MQPGGGTGDIASRMGALHVDTSMYTEAAKLEDETDEEKQDEEEQGGLFATSIGPQERRRLMVASMSPEDIVLCVDVCPEMSTEWAGAGPGGAGTSRMRVVQAALSGYVRRKSTFNPKHRFALLALGDSVRVMRALTSDVRSLLEAIERLEPDKKPENPLQQEIAFDFSELLACVADRFPPPSPSLTLGGGLAGAVGGQGAGGGAVVEVRPVVRALVVFGRSYTCPSVPASGTIPLLKHERFFLDCVYIHRKPSEEGVVCQSAFDLIAGMEIRGEGNHCYFLECGHSLLRFNTFMASLLAHPVQRDYQEAFFDNLAGGSGETSNTVTPTYRSSPPRGVNPAPSSSSSSNPSSVVGSLASIPTGVSGGSGSMVDV